MDYTILTEDTPIMDNINPEDRTFLLKEGLIEIKFGRIYPKFVGEVITPNVNYFSLPKNILDEGLIEPINGLLEKYRSDNEKRKLLTNTRFTLKKGGDFRSDTYFLKRLKTFFLDFVTYEFIYPLETRKMHSIEPLVGQIDMISSKINRSIYGDGTTYEVTDKKNRDSWLLDDIYYHTVETLADSYGSESEKKQVRKMKEYLNEEGYLIQQLDVTLPGYDNDKILAEIKKCKVNIIHNPIKNTLIDYYESKTLGKSSYSVNVFYTKDFEYVWESVVQKTLGHNPEAFGSEFTKKFDKTIEVNDYVTDDELENYIKVNKIKKYERDPKNKNYITYEMYDARPDLFSCASSVYSSSYKNNVIKFVGDAKYYNNMKTDFHKEFSTYNQVMSNKYPMVLLAVSDRTYIPPGGHKRGRQEDDDRELLIINISIKEVIDDYLNNKKTTLNKVHMFLTKRCQNRLSIQEK